MNKYIVTTTISPPTEATIRFSNMEGWTLIVVGDLKTPHEEYEKINCVYLHPDYQEENYKELSDAIGWKCIQRRNIGFVEAYRRGADIVATVDDDNIPYDTWGENVIVGQTVMVDCYKSQNGVFDPLSVTNVSELWHRGYPVELIPTKNNVQYLGKAKREVLVQADLWDGDPDVDAICRMTKQPIVKIATDGFYTSDQTGPFNSQNTFIHRSVLPFYMVLPHVGRMDDIWAAYIIQELFPQSVIFGPATVYQARNDHDLVKDLEAEILGYRDTIKFAQGNLISRPKPRQPTKFIKTPSRRRHNGQRNSFWCKNKEIKNEKNISLWGRRIYRRSNGKEIKR